MITMIIFTFFYHIQLNIKNFINDILNLRNDFKIYERGYLDKIGSVYLNLIYFCIENSLLDLFILLGNGLYTGPKMVSILNNLYFQTNNVNLVSDNFNWVYITGNPSYTLGKHLSEFYKIITNYSKYYIKRYFKF